MRWFGILEIDKRLFSGFLRNFRWLFFGDIVAKACVFASAVYLARVLGDEGFGKLSFIQAFLVYATVLAEFGLPLYGMREIAKKSGPSIELAGEIQALRLTLATGVCAAGMLLAWFSFDDFELRWLAIFSLAWLIPNSFSVDWIFRGLEKMHYVALGNFLQQAGFVALVFLLVRSANDLVAVPLYRLAGGTMTAVVMLWILRRNFGGVEIFWKNLRPKFSLCKASLPLGVSYILVQIYSTFDTIMLGMMGRAEVVGWYNAGYKIVNTLLGLNALIVSAFFPQLTAAFFSADGREKFFKIFAAFKRVLVAFSVFILILVPLARWIIFILYGGQYSAGVLSFQILLLYTAIALYSSLYGNALLAMKKEGAFLFAVGTGAFVNLVLNFILIPRYQLNGAAAATLISEIAVLGFMLGQYRRARPARHVEPRS